MLGEAVEDQYFEAWRLVGLAQDDVRPCEAGLHAAAGPEDARMQVDARALGKQLACAWPRDRDGRARLRYVGHGGVEVAERGPQPRCDLLLAAAGPEDQPLVGS